MKIEVIGGGPAGLYFSLLMKKHNPDHEITIHELNRHDDTFGFGRISRIGTTSTSISKVRSSAVVATISAACRARNCCYCYRTAAANSALP